MRRSAALALPLLLAAAPAAAQPFPARTGESGLLDVPDAEVAGLGRGQLAAELRLDDVGGAPADVGPLPLYVVAGAAERIEVGLTAREWGTPGDPRPARMLFGAAAKLRLVEPSGPLPGAALSAGFDRFNERPVTRLRLALSTRRLGPARFAAFAGGESRPGSPGDLGFAWGAAGAFALPLSLELVAEATGGPNGANYGAAVRWQSGRSWGLGLGVNRLPDDDGWRFALTFAFAPAGAPPARRPTAPAAKAPPEEPPTEAALALGDRPRFRLRIPMSGPDSVSGPRHRQHGVRAAPVDELPAGPRSVQQAAAAGPSAEDVFESQLRDQEAAADARERRLRSTEESLRQREAAASADGRQLEARDQQLAAREVQLDAREKRIALRGPPTQAERALESQEAQLGAQERQLAAQERSLAPTLDAAAGRERDAAAREQLERADAERLAEEWKRARDRVAQLDLRRQALSARQRQLSALEARLLAVGERVDAAERQVRARAERLDAWSRRLDLRAERLEILERRTAEGRKAPETTRAPEPGAGAAAAEAREKAVFVMVVKAPTSIVKEGGAPPEPGAAAGPSAGAAVEKGVAAATVVTFPTPQSELSELDREAIENVAKLAAREGTELLVWARAKSPALLSEAQRRADAIKRLATGAAQLDPKRVVTRVTTRPGAVGVDVVVSALRDAAPKPAQPAAPGGAPAPAQPPIQMLGAGETGKRQIRDAVLRAQPAIEACVGEQILRRKLTRAEGVLKLTVAANGKVVIVKSGDGDLAGPELEGCLTQAAKGWQFPASEGEYVVDVPITVIGGGAK